MLRICLTALVLSILSTPAFAGAVSCETLLNRLVHSSKEGSRFVTQALENGYSIELDEVAQVNEKSKFAKDYMRLGLNHLQKADELEAEIKKSCFKAEAKPVDVP